MLSLTRRKNQSIIIVLPNKDKIVINVSKISPNQCQLNFDLPSKNYIVDRAEIHEFFERKRKEEQLNASTVTQA
jgi:sRNA-binding carbon storage regulator CsrA